MIERKPSRQPHTSSEKNISLEHMASILLEAAIAGGQALLAAPFDQTIVKSDGSPVTPADLASDAAIQNILQRNCPDIRCVSEENIGSFCDEDAKKPFFLVDPLDGTKEYIAGKADFAVCIGYIVNQRPVAGVILAPLLRKAWLAARTATTFDLDSQLQKLPSTARTLRILETKDVSGKPAVLRIVTSRSHADPRSLALISKNRGSIHHTMGSAVKFTALANGDVDIYPRGSGTMEWDTAAGEALIMAAGGTMLDANGALMHYGQWKKGFRNEAFIAASSRKLVTDSLAQWEAC